MSTPLKRQTARLNSLKSTGARTTAGKRIISQNAVRHGMLANSVVLQGEASDRFIQISENFNNEIQPQSETERALVDMMCTARWRQMRLWGIERVTITQEMLNQVALLAAHDTTVETRLDIPAQAALGFRSLADNTRSLDLINRYETANSRLFFRALQQLTNLRAHPEPEPEPDPQTPENENFQTKPNIDFSERNQQPTGEDVNSQSTSPSAPEAAPPAGTLNLFTPNRYPYVVPDCPSSGADPTTPPRGGCYPWQISDPEKTC
jgi:hypothetical protein